jgi:uncharacterized SAM-binding protein YcdF (DUF218 family)
MDTALFVAAKLAGAVLRFETWLLLALGLGLLAMARKRLKLALGLCGASFAAILCLTILPIGDLLLEPVERRYRKVREPARLDGIIVLGGGEDAPASRHWGQVQLGEGAERYTAALALARRHPEARVLFTGGSGALRGGVSEASIAARFFSEQGLPADRLLLEAASRNTRENARSSLALAKPEPGERWVLVTSAFHMPRAMQAFSDAGWQGLIAWPVDHRSWDFGDGIGWDLPRNIRNLNTATKELAGAAWRSAA